MIYRVKAKCVVDDVYEIEAESADEALSEAVEWAHDDFASDLSLELVDEDGCPIEN